MSVTPPGRTKLKQPNLAILTILAALLPATAASAQMLPGFPQGDATYSRNFVSGGSLGYLMMPPVLVSGPIVESADWSHDGKYVAIRRTTSRMTAKQTMDLLSRPKGRDWDSLDSGDQELLIYSRQGKLFPIWKTSIGKGSVAQIHWLAGGVLAALTEYVDAEGKPRLVHILARPSGGGFSTSTLPETSGFRDLFCSHTKAAAVVDTNEGLYVIRTAGRDSLVNTKSRPKNSTVVWSADGAEPYIEVPGEEGQKRYYALSGSEPEPLDQAPALFDGEHPDEPELPVRVRTQESTLSRGSASVKTVALWLEVRGEKDKSMPGLLCADALECPHWSAADASLSPTGDAALYITADGAAMVRSLVPVDIGLVTQARETAFRTTLLHWGKQIGQAIHMFATDNDERLPAPNEFADSLKEYIHEENALWLQLFQYTHTGGSLNGIDNPSEAMLGYLPGPGGFAVVYADGHTQWKSGAP